MPQRPAAVRVSMVRAIGGGGRGSAVGCRVRGV